MTLLNAFTAFTKSCANINLIPASSALTAPANCFDGTAFTGSGRATTLAAGFTAAGFDFKAGFCFDECATDFIFFIEGDFDFIEGDFDRAIFLFLALADVGFFGI